MGMFTTLISKIGLSKKFDRCGELVDWFVEKYNENI